MLSTVNEPRDLPADGEYGELIDYAVGTYRDVVQTGLLTAEEYASGTGESVAEVKKRIEIVRVIDEFLDYLRLPEQYHVARDFQVYSLFQEMMAPLRQLDAAGQKKLKTIAFHNAMLKAMPDQRRFIREIKGLIRSGNCDAYFAEQEKQGELVFEKAAVSFTDPLSKRSRHAKQAVLFVQLDARLREPTGFPAQK